MGGNLFFASHKSQDAVIRNLQVLAESSKRLSPETKALAGDVDWRAIAGFRNVLVHDYLAVDLEAVWTVVEERVAPLKLTVLTLRQKLP